MRLLAIAGAALAFAILGSPAAAQQTTVPGEVQPAPPAQAEPPPFPPFPPAPSHRWVDMGEHHSRSSHHRGATHHHAAARSHHHAARVHHASRRHHESSRFSDRTIHRCHRMTYKLIMRDNLCRAMMTQDIRNHHRHAAHRHRSTYHHASAHRHHSRHRHRA
jgi:hypothetical protein